MKMPGKHKGGGFWWIGLFCILATCGIWLFCMLVILLLAEMLHLLPCTFSGIGLN